MENKEIIKLLKLTASLLELHGADQYKLRAYNNAVFQLDNLDKALAGLSFEELQQLEGVGKSTAEKISLILLQGTFPELDELLQKTPKGIIGLLGVKGIGPKKVRTLWQEYGIENRDELLKACEENRLAEMKGFGEKTQVKILEGLLFAKEQEGKFLYAEAEEIALRLEKAVKELGLAKKASLSGAVGRKLEIIDKIQLTVGHDDTDRFFEAINSIDFIKKDEIISGPFVWRGHYVDLGIRIEIVVYPEKEFSSQLFLNSSGKAHLLTEAKDGKNFARYVKENNFDTEEEIYSSINFAFIPSELREESLDSEAAKNNKIPALLETGDLKGILHNHSTYSDGKDTLRAMAEYCKELGYEYLGISDHSKSAFYANGLHEQRIKEQHAEIDELNQELAPFKIFKGIESDILNDGSLDYNDDILASFDFIVASVHSNLGMDIVKATDRLIKAVANPVTTILGHPTGRLLLRREGYPIDHKAVIDACAEYGVIMELNANPWRLDIDWRHIPYALEKGVMIGINPDAHAKAGYHDMYYGVCVARKGGLTKEMTFNALSLSEMEQFLRSKKEKAFTAS